MYFVQLIDSTPGCGKSNSGSIPGNLPNIVHKVKSRGGERTLVTLGTKRDILGYTYLDKHGARAEKIMD